MKRVLSLLITFIICISLTGTAWGLNAICGQVLNTDIKAYINGNPIKSYNIDGWTGVIAEDLRDYGFSVEWSEENRTLHIGGDGYTDKPTYTYQFTDNKEPVGSVAAYVYKTDIKTYVNGKVVKAFNIDGWTIIYIDELQVYGDVVWNEEKREISYTYKEPWDVVYHPHLNNEAVNHKQENSPATNGITSMSAEFAKGSNGDFFITGSNLGHFSWIKLMYNKEHGGLQLGFSMDAQHLLADEEFSQLCYNMVTNFADGTPVANNTNLANEHIKISINGEKTTIKEVRQEKGNNHRDYYFILDFDIPKEQIEKITIECFVQIN